MSLDVHFQDRHAGAVGFTVFGFDAQPILAQADSLKISRTTETRSTCPYCAVSCGVIIHTIGDKAKNVTPAGDACGRRSRSSDQPRHAVSEGRLAATGHPERSADIEASGTASWFRSLGRHLLGPGH